MVALQKYVICHEIVQSDHGIHKQMYTELNIYTGFFKSVYPCYIR